MENINATNLKGDIALSVKHFFCIGMNTLTLKLLNIRTIIPALELLL